MAKLEYSAEAWNPYNNTTADRLEHIQRAAARLVHHDYRHTTSVDIMILGWNRLHIRRLISQLTMLKVELISPSTATT